MQVPVYNLAAEVVRQIEISDGVFGVPLNEGLVHQAMVRQLANARQGTQSAKNRTEVSGSGKKLYRQKHTGNARMGARRSPIRRGGGVTFAPKPRDYRQDMPKKMRRLALRCVLSAKAGEGGIRVLDELKFAAPRTKEMVAVLKAFGVASPSLFVTAAPETNVVKSARNIPGVKTAPANLLNVLDILNHKNLFITEAAVRMVEQLWGNTQGGDNASLRGASPSADN
ncbi:MAG: 50S ribosomal protein L4 [Chloroflexi bacterium]|nr:50S ribosomal protein L4 [Chloroflexota bacterium]